MCVCAPVWEREQQPRAGGGIEHIGGDSDFEIICARPGENSAAMPIWVSYVRGGNFCDPPLLHGFLVISLLLISFLCFFSFLFHAFTYVFFFYFCFVLLCFFFFLGELSAAGLRCFIGPLFFFYFYN
jgi:hypothetical protein